MATEKARDTSQATNGRRKRRRKPRLTGLSKQRQTANARERTRMRSISAAMLQLRYRLPSSFAPKEKKLSKIQTLRLAIRYIGDLWNVLQSEDSDHVIHTVDGDIIQPREVELVDQCENQWNETDGNFLKVRLRERAMRVFLRRLSTPSN